MLHKNIPENVDLNTLLIINNECIKHKESSMYLGLNIDSQLKFNDHSKDVCSKLTRWCGILSKARWKTTACTRRQLFFAFVFPQYLTQLKYVEEIHHI